MSYISSRKKAVTVRVPAAELKSLMRARRIRTQSALFNTLLAEETERLASRQVLSETAGTAKRGEFDDRIL